MHGLPEKLDFQIFSGRLLEMVCITINQLYLHFDGDLFLTIEASYSFQETPDACLAIREIPTFDNRLLSLLGQTITQASKEDGGTLVIGFSSGALFKCYDPTSLYEAYRITLGKNQYII